MDLSVYWYGQKRPQVEALRANVNSEVVVVGGGIAGLTCAQALVERGVDVAVVEQAFCGAGASGKSSGFITPDSELELSDLVSNYGEAPVRSSGSLPSPASSASAGRSRRSQSTVTTRFKTRSSSRARRERSGRSSRPSIGPTPSLGYRSTLYDRASLEAILGSRAYQGGIRYAGTFGMNSFAYCRRCEAPRAPGRSDFRGDARDAPDRPRRRDAVRGGDGATVAVLTDHDLPALGLAAPAVPRSDVPRDFPAAPRSRDPDDLSGDRLMVWDTDLVYQYFRITGEGRLLLGGADLAPCTRRHESRSSERGGTKIVPLSVRALSISQARDRSFLARPHWREQGLCSARRQARGFSQRSFLRGPERGCRGRLPSGSTSPRKSRKAALSSTPCSRRDGHFQSAVGCSVSSASLRVRVEPRGCQVLREGRHRISCGHEGAAESEESRRRP